MSRKLPITNARKTRIMARSPPSCGYSTSTCDRGGGRRGAYPSGAASAGVWVWRRVLDWSRASP
eukprot:23146-Chlamydomonas_euryale.AAC.2